MHSLNVAGVESLHGKTESIFERIAAANGPGIWIATSQNVKDSSESKRSNGGLLRLRS